MPSNSLLLDFKDFFRGPNVSLLHSPSNLNGHDEQLVDNVKGSFSCHKERFINSLQFRSRTTPQLSVQVMVGHRKNLRSRCAAFTSKPKTDPTETYLDGYHPPPPSNPGTLETQPNHRPDHFSGSFRRPRKRSKVELVPVVMDQQLSPGGIRKNV
ncbi:hypothetical protein ACTXT7_016823 [Hymenolepis weldensis]